MQRYCFCHVAQYLFALAVSEGIVRTRIEELPHGRKDDNLHPNSPIQEGNIQVPKNSKFSP